MKTFTIYRSILLNQDEEINTQNLGCSWTLFLDFAQDHARDINKDGEKDGYVILEAEIPEDQIDWPNTLYAAEQRPHEYEVVVFDADISSEVIHVFGVDHIEMWGAIEGNTGSNDFEDYYDDYDGEITKEWFIEEFA